MCPELQKNSRKKEYLSLSLWVLVRLVRPLILWMPIVFIFGLMFLEAFGVEALGDPLVSNKMLFLCSAILVLFAIGYLFIPTLTVDKLLKCHAVTDVSREKSARFSALLHAGTPTFVVLVGLLSRLFTPDSLAYRVYAIFCASITIGSACTFRMLALYHSTRETLEQMRGQQGK